MISLNASVVANGLKSDLGLDLNRYNFQYRVTDKGERILTVTADSPAGNVKVVFHDNALQVMMNVLQQGSAFKIVQKNSDDVPEA
jgi:hypothetical protein